jgi:micrococcal nuclease
MADTVDFKRRTGRRPEQRRTERRRTSRRRSERRRADRLRPLLFALIGLAVGAFGALAVRTQDVSSPPYSGTFALCGNGVWRQCVIDGDTIRFADATIRLADINAPETRDAKCRSERALGDRATQRLRALLNAGPFTVVRVDGRDTDRYGRKLREIRRDGRSLGATLVAEGLARRWSGRRRSWCR